MNKKPIDQLPMQRTVPVDFSDDEDEDPDHIFLNAFYRRPSTKFNDNLNKVSYSFSNTFNKPHSKQQQAPMTAPKQNIRAAHNPITSRFSRLPELVPIPQTKRSTILVNGQSNIARDSLTQGRNSFSLRKSTGSPLLRKSYVSEFNRIPRYVF